MLLFDMHFPLPNSPYISVMACVSRPPPSSSSKAFEHVVSFATDFRRSKITSPVSKPPMSTASRAAMMIFCATFVPSSAASAIIWGEATASPMRSVNPASRSFSAVAGPTPGSSSMALAETATFSPGFSSRTILKAVTRGGL